VLTHLSSKKIKMLIALLGLTLLVSGCTSNRANQLKPDIYVDGDNIHYEGKIQLNAAFQFVRLVSQYPNLKTLYINSSGGHGHAGIIMANLMVENKMNVVVRRNCHSTCANYIFMAGHKKTLSRESNLKFHGGLRWGQRLFSDYESEKSAKNLTAINHAKRQKKNRLEYVKKELAFYKKLNIDINLPYYGQFSKTLKDNQDGKEVFYYKVEDLVSMGVKNISFKNKSTFSFIHGDPIDLTNELKAALPPPYSKYQLVIRDNEKERYEDIQDWIFDIDKAKGGYKME